MKFTLILSLALLSSSIFGSAEQVFTYPAEEPVFSIAFPDDWDVDDEDEQALSVFPDDELVSVELFALEADEAEGALKEVKAALADEFEEFKADKAQEGEVNNLKIKLFNANGKDEDGNEYTLNCALLTPGEDADTYFVLIFVASPEGLKKHGDALNGILHSLKGN
jgi:hypothetical protein